MRPGTGRRGRPLPAAPVAALALPLAVGLGGAALADVKLTPSVTTGLTLTDNRDFEPDGESDLLMTVSPTIELRQTGGRSNTALNYQLSGQYGARDSEFSVQHNLDATNTTEFIRDRFFVDTSAGIDQQVIDSAQGVPTRLSDDNENLATVQRYSVSPYWLEHFGSFADSSTRLRLGYVDSGSSELDDDTQFEGSTSLSSGRDFTSFFWDLSARYAVSDPGSDDERKTQTYRLDTETVVDRRFSLLGGIGYEKIQDDSLDDEPKGIIWDAGFRLRPGPKLTLRATYGERFDEQNINADLDYKITSRTSLSASYSQTLTTEQELFLSDLGFIGVDDDGNLIDTRTGLPIDPDSSLFGLSDDTFRRDLFTARFSTSRERDTYSANASYEIRESGSDDSSEIVKSVGVSWSHQLTRSMSLDTSVDYDNIDFSGVDEGRIDDLYSFRTVVSEQLSETVSATGTYLFRHLDSNLSDQDATENAVIFSLTKTF